MNYGRLTWPTRLCRTERSWGVQNLDSSSDVLCIEWESVEAHLEGFRKGAQFPAFYAAVKPFILDIVEMRHL